MPDVKNEAFTAALKRALLRLRRSEAFSEEVRRDLSRSGFDELTIGEVIAHLQGRGLLDDKRAIDQFLLARSGRRALGIARLREGLLARGAHREQLEAALAKLAAAGQKQQMLALLRSRRAFKDRAAAARLLLSRGFEEDEIEGALDQFFAGGD